MKSTILLLLIGLSAVYCITSSQLVGDYTGVWRVDTPSTALRFTLNNGGTGTLTGASIGGTRRITWTYYDGDGLFIRIDRSDLTQSNFDPKFQYAIYQVHRTGNNGIRLRGIYVHPNAGGVSSISELSKA